jgi:hypothetical protein
MYRTILLMDENQPSNISSANLQPGQQIHPGDQSAQVPQQLPPPELNTIPSQPTIAPLPSPDPNIPPSQVSDVSSLSTEGEVSWTAHEFIEHKKTSGWYLILIGVFILISIGIYFLSHSIFLIVMFLLMGLAFAIIAGRSPRLLKYELTSTGISIGKRFSNYNIFKSFSLADEEELGSIIFNPFKRFSYPITIYYNLADEEKIVNTLSLYLPIEEASKDIVEQLMRKLRF